MGDDLLTTVILATGAPVVVAPAMNTRMWEHPLVGENVAKLAETEGYRIVDPDAGELACKEVGAGRMPDPPVLVDAAVAATTEQVLAGKRVLVTAGPTREHIDPARMLTNPSTGKMGYAIAKAARQRGAEVTLVSGPTHLEAPAGVEFVAVETARQMRQAVLERVDRLDFVCKAAAVCDWRPSSSSDQKTAKSQMGATLELERNPDILAELGERFGPGGEEEGPTLIGFAAETHDVVERARAKLARKKAHLLVANRVGGEESTFGADQVRAHILTETGVETEFEPMTKEKLAGNLWRIAADYAAGG
jgi:phosphopantothenoylcysteine decarboxylase/phosphopantothenate--cysteine ligase